MSSVVLKTPLEPDSPQGVQPVSDCDDGRSSPECFFSLQPVGGYPSDDRSYKARKKERKRTDWPINNGLFLQNFSSSSATCEELMHFLDFSYKGVESEVDECTCSVNDLFEEALNFVFPDGVPHYYFKIESYLKTPVEKENKIPWKKVAGLMLEDFFREDHVQWLHDNYTLDYTNPTQKELDQQLQTLNICFEKEFKKKRNRKVGKTTGLAIKMHSLLDFFADNPDCYNNSDKCDHLKDILYGMTSILDITTQIDGAAIFQFHHLYIPGLITSEPSATLQVPLVCGSYPYCAIQVYEPDSKGDALQSLSSESSTALSPDCEGDSDTDNDSHGIEIINKKIRKTLSMEKIRACKRGVEFYSDGQSPIRKEYRREIATECPLNDVHNQFLAFKQSTGQLPLEMFGVMIAQDKIRIKSLYGNYIRLGQDEKRSSLGLFVMNELIYLEKLEMKHSVLRTIALDDRTGLKTNKSKCLDQALTYKMEGPKVYMTKWGFDLKKPNHRLAFLCFLYFYSEIAVSELVMPD